MSTTLSVNNIHLITISWKSIVKEVPINKVNNRGLKWTIGCSPAPIGNLHFSAHGSHSHDCPLHVLHDFHIMIKTPLFNPGIFHDTVEKRSVPLSMRNGFLELRK